MTCEANYWMSMLEISHPVAKTRFRHQLHRLLWRAYRGLPKGHKQPFVFTPLPGNSDKDGVYCLVQSARNPDWNSVMMCDTDEIRLIRVHGVKHVRFPLREGNQFAFRLTCAPHKNINLGANVRGKKIRLNNDHEISQWLERRSVSAGFQPIGYELGYTEIKVRKYSCEDYIPLSSCQFNGRLKVVDPQRLQAALSDGIGPKKIFGFGMLNIAPLKTS